MVTGAARGQGAAEAEALVREGARVIATDVEPAERVHGLVNNADITWRARVGDVRTQDMSRGVHAVNVTGPLLGIQHLAPLMPPVPRGPGTTSERHDAELVVAALHMAVATHGGDVKVVSSTQTAAASPGSRGRCNTACQ